MGKLMFNGVDYTGGGGGSGATQLSQLTDVNISNIQDGQVLKYSYEEHAWVNADEEGGGGGGSGVVFVELTQSEYDALSTEEKNNGTFYVISDSGKVLTGTLEAGHTSITFSDSAIKANSMIDVQTSILGVCPIGADDSTVGTITFYFNSQATDMNVKVVVT